MGPKFQACEEKKIKGQEVIVESQICKIPSNIVENLPAMGTWMFP